MALSRTLVRNRGGALGAVLRTASAGRARVGLGLAALAFAASSVAWTPDAHAYVVKKTTRGELVHWEETSVGYSLDASLDRSVDDGAAATRQAMVDWSSTAAAPEMHELPATAESPKTPGFDRKNGVFYMPNGYKPAGRALAITVLTYDNATGAILDADIVFNGSYRFAVLEANHAARQEGHENAEGPRPSATDGITHGDELTTDAVVYDLHHVIAHELGHSLGMSDEVSRRDALMYRYSAPNDATMRAPASDDIAGLSELYSTKLGATGNGCGSATVAPKKPTESASHLAMLGTLGLLLFLVLRGRSDRRARIAFAAAAAVGLYALLPSVAKTPGGVAHASTLEPGHARAKVFASETSMKDGILETTYKLATTACRASACPKLARGSVWGGTMGNIRQEVGGQFAPSTGDDVDVSFTKLPNQLATLSTPLGGSGASADGEVRVLTQAR